MIRIVLIGVQLVRGDFYRDGEESRKALGMGYCSIKFEVNQS